MKKLIMLDSHAPPVEVRCDACRHWGRVGGGLGPDKFGERLCDQVDATEWVRTGPDFGCAEFEAL